MTCGDCETSRLHELLPRCFMTWSGKIHLWKNQCCSVLYLASLFLMFWMASRKVLQQAQFEICHTAKLHFGSTYFTLSLLQAFCRVRSRLFSLSQFPWFLAVLRNAVPFVLVKRQQARRLSKDTGERTTPKWTFIGTHLSTSQASFIC